MAVAGVLRGPMPRARRQTVPTTDVARQSPSQPRLEVAADALAARLGRIGRTLQTGAFINRMWGEAGTTLGNVQMFLIRLLMIWPLRAVAPAAYAFWGWQLMKRVRGQAPSRLSRPEGLLPFLKFMISWASWESLQLWFSLEALFFVYYILKHWQLQRRVASAPLLPPGKPMEALKRALETIQMIQVGGKLAEPHLTLSGSMSRLAAASPPMSPCASREDLQRLLHSQEEESGVEQLLRDWHDSRLAAGCQDLAPVAVTDHSRAAIEQLADDAEVLALKQAEVSGWFLKHRWPRDRWPISRLSELRRGNIRDWVAWAFFNCNVESVPPARSEELEDICDEIIRWMELPIDPGYNLEANAMRLTMDPIPSAHRPLVYYAVTQTIFSQVIDFQLRGLGFRQHWSGTLAYWHRPGESRAQCSPPIVFCHGIGVNVLPYRPLLNEMLDRASDRSFFLISLPHISMRIKEEVPSSTEMVACLSDMLSSWGFASAHFVGHSFGSLPLAWMARKAPGFVSTMTFIDPVCFLLIKPDVCYNFMYRRPADPTQLLINYFLAKELYIAHSLSRNFFWFQNQLWPEELPGPTLVVLCGLDSIVPSHSVRRYLISYKQRRRLDSLRVLWFPDLGHGEINFGPVGEAACGRIVSEMLRLEAETKVSTKAEQ